MITSTQNALIKQTLALREAKERRATGLAIVDGQREIQRAIACGISVERIFYVDALPKELRTKTAEQIEVNDNVLAKLSFGDRHEGAVAVIKTPQHTFDQLRLSKKPVFVVLESVEKPGNLGAILRTCDAVGVEAILICDGQTDVFNPNVIRASTGVVFKLPVIVSPKEKILAFLQQHKVKICATFPDSNKIYTQVDLSAALALVMGAEDKGLSDFWAKHADIKVTIPMKGLADSLNVSTSAAVILYESLRQRN